MKKKNFSRNPSLVPQESQAIHGRYIDVFVFMDDAQGSQRLYSGGTILPFLHPSAAQLLLRGRIVQLPNGYILAVPRGFIEH